ncbi:MAG: hypothetical protein AAGG68_28290 [Bacteroidota bacterium]
MLKRKGLWTFIGFLLFLYGFLALILSLIGAKLSFLMWLDAPSPLFGFVAKVAMVMIGLVIVYLTRSDFSGERPPSS